jgi:hypothetical protein
VWDGELPLGLDTELLAERERGEQAGEEEEDGGFRVKDLGLKV